VCELSDIDEFITDDGISGEQLAALRALNVSVTVVPVERQVPEATAHELPAA
jgi:hypothetical protein